MCLIIYMIQRGNNKMRRWQQQDERIVRKNKPQLFVVVNAECAVTTTNNCSLILVLFMDSMDFINT